MLNSEEARDAVRFVGRGLSTAEHKPLALDEWRTLLVAASVVVQHVKVRMHIAATPGRLYRVADAPDTCSMEELIAANEDAPIEDAELIQVCSLNVGQCFTLAGGAAGECVVRRVT